MTSWFNYMGRPFACSNPQPNLGGLSIWIPPTMVNAMALILIIQIEGMQMRSFYSH
jgi:hypothetical protein